ncbi:TPA: hypothetical protein DD712_03180 [Candidatus Acetothermia bacterium]|nr:hypothetical protein [Candidatus Acetothermia bacterium]
MLLVFLGLAPPAPPIKASTERSYNRDQIFDQLLIFVFGCFFLDGFNSRPVGFTQKLKIDIPETGKSVFVFHNPAILIMGVVVTTSVVTAA